MKFFRTAVAALCAFTMCGVMVSCSDDDTPVVPEAPEQGDDTPTATEGVDVVAVYYGDYNDNNTGNFGLNFVTAGMEWDDFEETYIGPGSLVYFEVNSALCENPDFAAIKAGEYAFDADDECAEMTFGSALVTEYDADGNETASAVTGGTLNVEIATNGMYVLIGKFELESGSTYDFNYTGNISFVNRTGEGFMSNMTGDVTLDGMTQSAVLMWGETFTETSDYCSVIIAGKDYDMLENYGTSPAINLGLNITPGSTSIPAGTYTIIDATEADDYDEFTALSGVYEATYGGYFGCWYFQPQIEGAMLSGTVDVTDDGNGTYTFKVNLADGYGNKVTGTYTGQPTFYE